MESPMRRLRFGLFEVAGEVLYCGNGTVEGDEACDEAGDTSACDADTEADCGDGYLNTSANEACDDGNTVTEICDYGVESCEVCKFSVSRLGPILRRR